MSLPRYRLTPKQLRRLDNLAGNRWTDIRVDWDGTLGVTVHGEAFLENFMDSLAEFLEELQPPRDPRDYFVDPSLEDIKIDLRMHKRVNTLGLALVHYWPIVRVTNERNDTDE